MSEVVELLSNMIYDQMIFVPNCVTWTIFLNLMDRTFGNGFSYKSIKRIFLRERS